MTSHQKRLLTGLALFAILAVVVLSSSQLLLAIVLVAASCLALTEFWSMFWVSGRRGLKAVGLALAALIVGFSYMGVHLGLVLGLCLWLLNLLYLMCFQGRRMWLWPDVAVIAAGLVYIPLSLQFFVHLTGVECALVLGAVFASDTAAYYTGSLWGQRKLWPSISPKKTWAGSLGGLMACILVCWGIGLSLGRGGLGLWLAVGVVLNLAAQLGDLFESALKRELQVKDSGALLPGHGGILDRVDSLLLALPVYMCLRSALLLF